MKKIISLTLLLAMLLSVLTSCGFDMDFSGEEQTSQAIFDTYGNQQISNPDFANIPRNSQCDMSESWVQIDTSFVPHPNGSGYVTNATVTFETKGYDLDFTYFGASVIVTWTLV